MGPNLCTESRGMGPIHEFLGQRLLTLIEAPKTLRAAQVLALASNARPYL